MKRATVFFVCFLIFVFGVNAVTDFLTIPTTGHVETSGDLRVFPDTLDWGNVSFNVPISRNVNLTNVGNATITNLNLTWIETTSILINYSIVWNLEGSSINPLETKGATFILTVYDADEGDFTLNLMVNHDAN